ncbi:MAG: hypothetical protein REI11_10565 [Patulibacter sp.]|nr:hypothetical protein [Patulibacter sp.]
MSLTLEDLPLQPTPVDEAATLSELLASDELARFSMTFDGYEFYGEHSTAVLVARREEWEREGTLPRDVDAVRGLLFLAFRHERFVELDDGFTITDAVGEVVHRPDPERITHARREHERFKHALLERIRELLDTDGD